MARSGGASRSLAGTLFASFLAFTLACVVILATVLTSIYFFSYESEAEQSLKEETLAVAARLDVASESERKEVLDQQLSDSVRYTLIDGAGLVLYDSAVDAAGLGNHAERPEVSEAARSGEAVSLRYSETLGTDTVYAAARLSDGGIVRLAETRHSLLSFLGAMLAPVLVALAAAAALVLALSRALTRRIMRPLGKLDFAEPLQNDIYEEMQPLLVRIDDQQRQLKEQNRELAQAESMRRDFSSNVSHEMKTPLQVISGYAELMRDGLVAPEDRTKFAGLIYDEAQAMRSLIDDVLTLSRLDESALSGEVQRIDMHEVAERAAERLASFAASRGVVVHVRGERACISGNASLAQEMAYNLIENAVRYNREGGSVEVEVREVAGAEASRRVVVRVSDTGPGIPEDAREKVFERFFRLEKSRSKETGGTGLGLAIVKHAVLYHKGSIRVEQSPQGGAEFIAEFPAGE